MTSSGDCDISQEAIRFYQFPINRQQHIHSSTHLNFSPSNPSPSISPIRIIRKPSQLASPSRHTPSNRPIHSVHHPPPFPPPTTRRFSRILLYQLRSRSTPPPQHSLRLSSRVSQRACRSIYGPTSGIETLRGTGLSPPTILDGEEGDEDTRVLLVRASRSKRHVHSRVSRRVPSDSTEIA